MFFGILKIDQIAEIHLSSLQILETIGVRISSRVMRWLFADAGATVDETKELVCIPERVVAAYLISAGKHFILDGRESM